MKKNDLTTLTFTDWAEKGLAEGSHIKVPYAAPGDTGHVLITKENEYGKLLSLSTPSPNRVDPPCNIFEKCGGCHLQHVSYTEQLRYKQHLVQQALDLPTPPEIIPSKSPYNYRNKAQLTISESQIGLSAPRSQRIIDCTSCDIQHPLTNQVLTITRKHLENSKLTQLITRIGTATNELMVGLVSDTTPNIDPLVEELKTIPELKSLYLNHNPNPQWQVMGDSETLLWGTPTITDIIAGLKLNISLRSFFQINASQIEPLWQTISTKITGKHIWDLYCGTGSMTLYLAQKFESILGVESHPEAIKDAQENAKLNTITNVEFIQSEVETLASDHPCDTLIVDPPRSGLSKTICEKIISLNPEQLMYISCSPETLARDLKRFENYTIDSITLVDMFPQTYHIETVVSLTRK